MWNIPPRQSHSSLFFYHFIAICYSIFLRCLSDLGLKSYIFYEICQFLLGWTTALEAYLSIWCKAVVVTWGGFCGRCCDSVELQGIPAAVSGTGLWSCAEHTTQGLPSVKHTVVLRKTGQRFAPCFLLSHLPVNIIQAKYWISLSGRFWHLEIKLLLKISIIFYWLSDDLFIWSVALCTNLCTSACWVQLYLASYFSVHIFLWDCYAFTLYFCVLHKSYAWFPTECYRFI